MAEKIGNSADWFRSTTEDTRSKTRTNEHMTTESGNGSLVKGDADIAKLYRRQNPHGVGGKLPF